MASGMRLRGHTELIEGFKKLPLEVRRKVLQEGLQEIAGLLLFQMQSRVPVDTGQLESTLEVVAEPGDVPRVNIRSGAKDPKGRPYWAPVEFGHGNAAPRPFIRPAVRAVARGRYAKTICAQKLAEAMDASFPTRTR